MLHYITIGFLDEGAAKHREIRPLAPIPLGLVALLQQFLDSQAPPFMIEGMPVTLHKEWIRCPWYAPKRNRTVEKFAVEASRKFRCVLADIEHGRVISLIDIGAERKSNDG